jgi:two-component system CheB/CheR fusion protein
LRPAPGQASLNIVEMAREGLELDLRTALCLAASEGVPTLNRDIPVKTNVGYTTVKP